MFDSTNVVATTIQGNVPLSSLVDGSNTEIRFFTGVPGDYTPTDIPPGATGTIGFIVMQFGPMQFYQEEGGLWLRTVLGGAPQNWIKLQSSYSLQSDSNFPYGFKNLTLDYQPIQMVEPLYNQRIPGIYMGDSNAYASLNGDTPSGASGQGFAVEVKTFPMVHNGATFQGYSQTYTDSVGEWKRVFTSAGTFTNWVQVTTF